MSYGKIFTLESKVQFFPKEICTLISKMGCLLSNGWPIINSPIIPKVIWYDMELDSNLRFITNETDELELN